MNQFSKVIKRVEERNKNYIEAENKKAEVISLFNEEANKASADIIEIFEGLDKWTRIRFIGDFGNRHMDRYIASINRGGYEYGIYVTEDYGKGHHVIRVGYEACKDNVMCREIPFNYDESNQQLRIKFQNALKLFVKAAYRNGPAK